ncbi:MAG: hypothetical protein ACOX60_10395 [Massiliimalia sp.]|jgi:ABC-type transport system involved in multi-copper enzyme maturation permease subunit
MTLNTSPLNPKSSRFGQAVRDDLRRNLPYFICFCVLCLVILILPMMLAIFNDQNTGNAVAANLVRMGKTETVINVYQFGLNPFSVIFFPAMAFLLGLLQFAFLTNRRAMDVYGSLPIKRTHLFWAKVASAGIMLTVPTVLSYLILFLLNGSVYGFTLYLFWELLLDIFLSLFYLLIVYSITIMVCALTGTIVENVLYPPLLLVMPVAIYGLVTQRFSEYNGIYGFSMSSSMSVFYLLFPFIFPFGETDLIQGISQEMIRQEYFAATAPEANTPVSTFSQYLHPCATAIIVWVLLTVIFMGLGFYFYQRRPSELAGKRDGCRVLTWLSGTFGITVAGLFVMFLCQNLWGRESIFVPLQYPLFFLITLCGFFIFQVIIRRSVKESFRSMKGYLAVLPFYAVFFAAIFTNGFGIYNHIPQIDEIKSVTTNYNGFYSMEHLGENFTSSEPDTIETVWNINQTILDTKEDAYSGSRSLSLIYTLKNGKTVSRTYYDISDTADEALLSLNFADDFAKYRHTAFQTSFTDYTTLSVSDQFGTRFTEVTGQVDFDALQKAYQQDVLDETLEDFQTPSAPDAGMIQLTGLKNTHGSWGTIYLPVKSCYKNTLSVLESSGVLSYLEPDYSAIEYLMVADEGYQGEFIWTRQGVYSKYDLPGSLGDGYYPQSSLTNRSIPFRKVTDPQEIQSILEHTYSVYRLEDSQKMVMVPATQESMGNREPDSAEQFYWPFLYVE